MSNEAEGLYQAQTATQEAPSELAVPDYGNVFPPSVNPQEGMLPDYTAAGEDGGIIDFDVTDIRDPFAPAPQGNYRLRIEKYEVAVSKNSGNPMIKAEFAIVGPESAGEHLGKNVFDNMVTQGDGAKFGKWRHRQITQAVGLPLTGGVPARSYVGKEFDAELRIDPGDNVNRPKNVIWNVFTA